MAEESSDSILPTAEQMKAYFDVQRAVRLAARLREASRALLTGWVATGLCIAGTMLAIMHDTARFGRSAPIVACLLIYPYLGYFWWCVRVTKRYSDAGMTPLEDLNVVSPRSGTNRSAIALRLAATFGLMAVSTVMWSYAFRVMSTSQILLALSIAPVAGIVFHLIRLVRFEFWEEGLLACASALAYAPLLMRSWELTPLCFVALGLTEVAKWSMFLRWLSWRAEQEAAGEEGKAESVS